MKNINLICVLFVSFLLCACGGSGGSSKSSSRIPSSSSSSAVSSNSDGSSSEASSNFASTLLQSGSPVYSEVDNYKNWLSRYGDTAAKLVAHMTRADNMIIWQLPTVVFIRMQPVFMLPPDMDQRLVLAGLESQG